VEVFEHTPENVYRHIYKHMFWSLGIRNALNQCMCIQTFSSRSFGSQQYIWNPLCRALNTFEKCRMAKKVSKVNADLFFSQILKHILINFIFYWKYDENGNDDKMMLEGFHQYWKIELTGDLLLISLLPQNGCTWA
jgi:hypothetical protein